VSAVRVTPRALKDLDDIADYTLENWGARQAEKYLAELSQRFKWLADNPDAGQVRDEIGEGYRSYRQGSHQIFYLVEDDVVAIVGVPHGSMDIDAYFRAPG